MSRELYSLEAEHGLLGALLLDASLFDAITARITTADFAPAGGRCHGGHRAPGTAER
ncbi:DnaB domain-containing protein [Pseudomonas syringae pv. actinidiae ICMP 19068]|nr:DnaB domain-containing protein [Pseudomonas syringae pv. actinidiae ICMP 19068]